MIFFAIESTARAQALTICRHLMKFDKAKCSLLTGCATLVRALFSLFDVFFRLYQGCTYFVRLRTLACCRYASLKEDVGSIASKIY